MPCCTALQTANFSDCNQSRTLLRVSWLELGAPTTLRRFSSHFIGCRCDNASLSSWRHWFTSAWTAEHLDIWPTTSALWSSWLTVSRQYDAGHPSYDDVTGRQSICRRRTACLEQPAIRDPSLSLSIFGKLLKTYLFKVAALVTYE